MVRRILSIEQNVLNEIPLDGIYIKNFEFLSENIILMREEKIQKSDFWTPSILYM